MGIESLAVVMPTYNEEGCIEKVCQSWLEILAPLKEVTLIVVNDGSRDKTGEILDNLSKKNDQLIVLHQPNQGHGASVLNGYREVVRRKATYVFQVDSDDQFEPLDFFSLWKRRKESSFILGFRKKRHDPLHRLIITQIVRFCILLFMGVWIKDANIPFRLIEGQYLEKILSLLPEKVFAPNLFLSVIAKRGGQPLLEIPVTHKIRKTGKISIVKWGLIKVCIRSARELFAFRKRICLPG